MESKFSSSLNKRKKNKKKKSKTIKIKAQFKSHTLLNTILEKINFDFESAESEKTIKLNNEENEISSIGPKTIKNLPKSLKHSLKKKIENDKLVNKKENNFELGYYLDKLILLEILNHY